MNAGHSSVNWLISNPWIYLLSFDLGEHSYIPTTKHILDEFFPKRHSLILGSSVITVPMFVKNHSNFKCDVLHVDGGHFDDIPIRGIIACLFVCLFLKILLSSFLIPYPPTRLNKHAFPCKERPQWQIYRLDWRYLLHFSLVHRTRPCLGDDGKRKGRRSNFLRLFNRL